MLNFRKLRQDYAPQILRDGKILFDKGGVQSAKVLKLTSDSIRVLGKVLGQFDHTYTCELEIDRMGSSTLDSDCDCPSKYDCQHQAAFIYHLEEHLNDLIVAFSKNGSFEEEIVFGEDEDERQKVQETIKQAEHQAISVKGKKLQKELLEEYVNSSRILGQNPFFLPEEEHSPDKAEIAIIFSDQKAIEVQVALRLPFRSKPLHILHLKDFLEAFRFEEPIYIGNKQYFFNADSFDKKNFTLLRLLIASIRFPDIKGERNHRVGVMDSESFGKLLSEAYLLATKDEIPLNSLEGGEEGLKALQGLYLGDLETPLRYSTIPAAFRFEIEYLISSAPKIMLKTHIIASGNRIVQPQDVHLFESEEPGMIHERVYYRFQSQIKRKHLRHLFSFRDLIIPQPLFGTFVENSLPELLRFAEIANREVIEQFVTLPFVNEVGAECDISYLEGEFEAVLRFVYDDIKVPLASASMEISEILAFATKKGILARNLTEEEKIVDELFQDFLFDPATGIFKAKSDKKIVEFMTEVIPRFQQRVKFNCPENLLDRFVYDNTKFILHLRESARVDAYEVDLKVIGALKGLTLDQLWECLSSRRPYVELATKKGGKKGDGGRLSKILVLNLDQLTPVVQVFDEIGIQVLESSKQERPLWSLASIEPSLFEGLPIEFSMSEKLIEIQKQMLGLIAFTPDPVPEEIQATLRPYQVEGVTWLERLRRMHLNGILADDMGLGKTLQAIIALTQYIKKNSPHPSIVVCPTSLVYNWKEELSKFNPCLKVLAVDGNPQQRKKLHAEIPLHDVIITSYSLLQKDIDLYKAVCFAYAILDEAQHIKNRGTRNAKSVKLLQAAHRIILSGTPIENSLDELWSLFDFLMPGLLSSYDRFIEKYVRNPHSNKPGMGLETLKKKVSPFILRRMKEEVLDELPPVSDIVYHCHLSEAQRELYRSYAMSAREELSKLVKQEGFDKVQIHVLATLTRLKQICCHPAIFAKEKAEPGDSAKYDMLIELLQTLIAGKHRTVVFSQYTKMLHILREDLQNLGIPFEYLDGSSKNRLSIVKRFNEDQRIPVFLVSLKAGGAGLNLIGADTVIHYDMWWNPAVENQATDRVHRIGQKNSVSSYKLVTLDSIEEKIVELQNRKKELVRQVVTCEEEAIAKLTWEEVLELLQT